MLRNNADARRCSFFELGLPVISHHKIRQKSVHQPFSMNPENIFWPKPLNKPNPGSRKRIGKQSISNFFCLKSPLLVIMHFSRHHFAAPQANSFFRAASPTILLQFATFLTLLIAYCQGGGGGGELLPKQALK